jgi:hypothetical protein
MFRRRMTLRALTLMGLWVAIATACRQSSRDIGTIGAGVEPLAQLHNINIGDHLGDVSARLVSAHVTNGGLEDSVADFKLTYDFAGGVRYMTDHTSGGLTSVWADRRLGSDSASVARWLLDARAGRARFGVPGWCIEGLTRFAVVRDIAWKRDGVRISLRSALPRNPRDSTFLMPQSVNIVRIDAPSVPIRGLDHLAPLPAGVPRLCGDVEVAEH